MTYEELKKENERLRNLLADILDPLFNPRKEMGELAHFAPTERKLLCVLWAHKGECVNKKAIVNAMYAFEDDIPNSNFINVIASRIRTKLKHHVIVPVHQIGFILKVCK